VSSKTNNQKNLTKFIKQPSAKTQELETGLSSSIGFTPKSTGFIDNDWLLYFWHVQKVKLTMSQVDSTIDLSKFNKSHLLIRNLDFLSDQQGGYLSMDTAIRAIYMDVQQSTKPSTIQNFSLSRLNKKYSKLSFLDNHICKGLASVPNTVGSIDKTTNLNDMESLDLFPKKIIESLISKNLNIAKQNR
jgi:hypothetical protein